MVRYNFNWLNPKCILVTMAHTERYIPNGVIRERLCGILGKHRDHDVVHNLQFRLIGSSNLYENISCIQGYLRMITVDNRRQRTNDVFGIVDDGINGRIPNDMKIFVQIFIFLQER